MLTKTDIEQFFISEKNISLFLMIAGAVTIIAAIIFFVFVKTNLYKSIAIPLLVLGALQLFMGYSAYSKADKMRIDNVYAFDMNPGKLKTEELPRMHKMIDGVKLFLYAEIAVLLIGIIVTVMNRQTADAVPTKTLWMGIGIGLMIQAFIFLCVDAMVLQHAKKYTAGLEKFSSQ